MRIVEDLEARLAAAGGLPELHGAIPASPHEMPDPTGPADPGPEGAGPKE